MAETAQRQFGSTPFQRLCIRTLLREIDLPTDKVSGAHSRLFVGACIPSPNDGEPIDPVLWGLTSAQAAALIGTLQHERKARGLPNPLPEHHGGPA